IQVATKDPAPPTAVDPTLGQDVDYILARALAKDPDRRYQRGRHFSADIQEFCSGGRPRSAGSEDPKAAVGGTRNKPTAAAPPGGRGAKLRFGLRRGRAFRRRLPKRWPQR